MPDTLSAVACASAIVLALWGAISLTLVFLAFGSGRARCSEGDADQARAEAARFRLTGGARV